MLGLFLLSLRNPFAEHRNDLTVKGSIIFFCCRMHLLVQISRQSKCRFLPIRLTPCSRHKYLRLKIYSRASMQ